MAQLKKLPIGIQTFSEIREENYLYIDKTDHVAKQGCEVLKDLYTTIKDSDEYIKFAFLTGVSKFSKVSVFSGLNNLEDIELEPILFQAGYLSIKSVEISDFGYELVLVFPHREVTMSFNDILIRYLTATSNTLPVKKDLLVSLKLADLNSLEATIVSLFASIPYNNHVKNPSVFMKVTTPVSSTPILPAWD